MIIISSNPATIGTKLQSSRERVLSAADFARSSWDGIFRPTDFAAPESTLSDRLCTKNQLIQNTTHNPDPNTVELWTDEVLELDRRASEAEERKARRGLLTPADFAL